MGSVGVYSVWGSKTCLLLFDGLVNGNPQQQRWRFLMADYLLKDKDQEEIISAFPGRLRPFSTV